MTPNNIIVYAMLFKFSFITLMVISMAVCDYKGFIRRRKLS